MLGVPGASLQTGRTYLVVAMDAAGGGDVQVCTVRFTGSLASNATGNAPAESTDTSTDTLASSSPSVAADVPSAEPSAGLSGGESTVNVAGQENGAKVRGVRSATALAGPRKTPPSPSKRERTPRHALLRLLHRSWGTARAMRRMARQLIVRTHPPTPILLPRCAGPRLWTIPLRRYVLSRRVATG